MFKTETLDINMSAGDYTLDAADLLDVTTIQIRGNVAPRVLTFPQIRKLLQVVNAGSWTVTLALGSSTVPMPAGAQAAIYLNGDLLAGTGGGAGTGAITFLMLTDVPNSYEGKHGQVLVVNDAENGLVFSAAAAGQYTAGVGLELDGITFNIADPDLLAFMALNPVANSVPFFTSATAMSLIATTPFGRGLLAETDGGTLLATINAQPHSANLDVWSGLLPSAFQPANPNLDLWAGVTPSQFLLGTAIGSTVQAHSANLDSWSAIAPNTKVDVSSIADVLRDGDIGQSVQGHSANLDDWSGVLTSDVVYDTDIGTTVQPHDATLDAWAAIDPSTKADVSSLADVLRDADVGTVVQAHDADLDAWALIAPSTKQDHSANLDGWSALVTSAKQDHSTNLDGWSGVAVNAKVNVSDIGTTVQAHSANLDGWSALATSAKQNHSANLDGWSATDPAILDTFLTDADLTDVLRVDDIGSIVQGYSATLTAWAGIAPSTKVDVSSITDMLRDGDIGVTVQGWSSNLDEWSALNPTTELADVLRDADIGVTVQAHSVNLDAWSALATSSKINTTAIGVTVQPYNANLANWAAKTVPTGQVVGDTDVQTLTNKIYTDITTTMFAANVIDTDVNLAANANTRLATQRAVKAYADAISVLRTYTAGTGLGLTGNQFNITDQELLAFAGLTLAANTLPYATSASAMTTTPFTAFARTLLDDADQAAMKTTLGLVIGTNVQAWNSLLDTWATKTAPIGTVVGTTDTQTLTGKTLDAGSNTITGLTTGNFAANVIDNDPTLAANSSTRVPSQNAVKSYIDNVVSGIKWKPSVRTATTANITLSGTQTIDGIAVIVGDRVLVKNQTTGSQNGIYVVAAGAWTRTTDADTGTKLISATVQVDAGTLNADTQWNCNNDTITLGTTAIVFVQISGAGTYTAGFGLSLVGNQFSLTEPELLAFAGLTLTADNLPYANGTGTMAMTPFTAFARTLMDDANQGAMQTTLGLVPGTNVQAYDALLAALAGLTTAADTMPYFTGVDTVATTSLSAFMRTVLDDTTQAAALSTLGALSTSGGTVTGDIFHSSGAYVMGAGAAFTTRSATNSVTPNFQIQATGANASFMLARFGNDANHARAFFAKSRGSTVGSHGAVQPLDFLGEFSFGGSDGTKICEGAMIRVQAQEAPGTNYTPSTLSFYTSNTGGASAPTEKFRLDHMNTVSLPAGILVSGTTASVNTIYVGSVITPQMQAHSAATTAIGIYRWGASISPGLFVFSKSRGGIGVHAAVNSGDQVGVQNWVVSDGTNFVQSARMAVTTTAVPNTGVGCASRIDYIVHTGTAEVLSFGCDQNGNMTMNGGSNIVVTQTRHPQLRSYTVATLPVVATSGQLILVSDLGGGAGMLISIGSVWTRVAEQSDYYLNSTNADVASSMFGQGSFVELTATITANRTYTLPTTLRYTGARRRVLRTGGGNFNWVIAPVSVILGVGDWVECVFDGTNWRAIARGNIARKVATFTSSGTFIAKDSSGLEVSIIEMDSASPITLTVPNDTNASTQIGDMIEVFQVGAGQVTIAADTGVTLQSPGGLVKIYAQYGSVFLRKRAANTWALTGGLTS